jgi:uncharacterized protein YjbJ (UPF0337 family)
MPRSKTADDLGVIAGKREELAGRLQTKIGYLSEEKAEEQVDDWVKKL